MAPEIILCIPFDQRIDIFSYGIVLCELAMGVIASENILTRRIPGFGIRSDEVVEATRLRISRENASFGADESQDVLDDFTTAFLDIAFLSSAEEPSDRCDWKLIMKRLKVLEGNIKETAKEQGLIGYNLANSISIPSLFQLTSSASAARLHIRDSIQKADPIPLKSERKSSLKSDETQNMRSSEVRKSQADNRSSIASKLSKLTISGLQHEIPHKLEPVHGFSVFKLILKGTKCEVCAYGFLKADHNSKPLNCKECGAVFHKGCEDVLPPSCGLPKDLRCSLFPASSKQKNLSKTTYERLQNPNHSAQVIFHGFDGDHIATKEFVDAVNPDIHPPTPPVTRRNRSQKSSERLGSKSAKRFTSEGALSAKCAAVFEQPKAANHPQETAAINNAFSVTIPAMEDVPAFTGNPPDNLPETSSARSRPRSAKTSTNPPSRAQSGKSVASSFSKHELNQPPFAVSSRRSSKQNSVAGSVKSSIRSSRNIDRSDSQTRKAAELSTAEITSAFAPHSQSNSAKPSREGSAILRSKQQSNEKIASKSASLHFSKADLLRSASKNSLKKSGSQDVMPNSVAERFSVQGSSPFLSKTNSGLSVGSRIDDDDPAIQQLRELIKQTIDVPANDDPVGTDAWAADIVKQNDEEEKFEELCWEMARLIITEAQEELRQERESKKQSDTNRESKVDSTSSIPLSKASSTKDVARTEDQRRTESTVISKKTSTVDVKPSSLPSSQKVLSKSASKDDLKVMSKSASRLTTEDSNSTSHPDLTRASKSASKGNLQTSSKTASKENFLNEEPITTSSVSKTPSRTAIPTTDVSGEVKRASSKQASKVSSVPVSRPLSRSASKSHSKSASRPMSHHQSRSHLAEELIPEPESEVEAILRAGDPNEAPQVELQDNQQPNALNESNDERLILSNSDHSRTASSQAKIQRSSDSIHNSKAVSKRGSVISGSRASLKEGSVRNSRKELSGSDFIAENNEKDNLDKQENLQSERNDDQSNRGSVSLKPDLQSELSDKGTVSGDNPSKPSSKRHSLKDFTENSSEQPALELESKSLVEPELGAQETVAKQISVLSQPISKQASKIHVDGSNGEDAVMADPDIQRQAMKSQHQDSQILKSRTASGFVPSPAVNSHTSPNPSKLASPTISVQSSKQQLGETQVEDSRNVDVKQEISKMGSKTASGLIHEQDILQSHTKSKSSLVISRELSQHSSNSRSQLDEIHAEEKTNPENDIHEETDKNLRMGSQILGSKTASAFISPEGEAPASSTPPAASKPISRTLSLQHSQPNVTSEPIKSQSKQHSIIASEKSQIISEGEIINSPRLSSVDAPSKLASNINLQHSKKSSVADLERSISKQVSSSAIVTSTKQSKRGSKITISGDDILTNKSANGTPKIQSKQASKPISRSGSVISESRNIGSKSSVVEQKLDGRSVQNESSSRPVSSRASDSGPPVADIRGSQENFAAETLESFKITERSVSQLAQSVTEDTPVTNEAIEAAANRDYDYATETDFEPLRTTSKRASVKELIEEHEGFIRSQSPAHSRKGTESVSQSTPKNASALASRQGSIRGSKPVSRAISQTGSILEAKSETHLEQRTAVAEEYENDYEDHNEFEEPVTDQNDAINHEADEAIASVNNEAEKLDVSAEFHQEEAIPGDAVDSNQPNEYTFDDFETHSVIGINTDTNAPVENHKDESAESSERLSENKPQHSLISEKQNST
ncbi:hypothetical protein HDU82_001505, partial [Entophlyctis luteolus]